MAEWIESTNGTRISRETICSAKMTADGTVIVTLTSGTSFKLEARTGAKFWHDIGGRAFGMKPLKKWSGDTGEIG